MKKLIKDIKIEGLNNTEIAKCVLQGLWIY